MSQTIRLYDQYRHQVAIDSIEFIQAEGTYCLVHRQGQARPLLVCHTLKAMHSRLPDLIRIHKGTLVNPAHVVGSALVRSRSSALYLSHDRTLVVSRGYATAVLELMAYRVKSLAGQASGT